MAVETINYKGCVIDIDYDDNAESPRIWGGNIATFVCEHRNYRLGDEYDIDAAVDELFDKYVKGHDDEDLTIDEKLELIEKTDEVFILPISIYDHSGVDIWLGSTAGHVDARWDCSTVGFAYIEKSVLEQKTLPSLPDLPWKERAEKIMDAEMDLYASYVRGEVYGYMIDGLDDCPLDSCWGYYGDEGLKDAIAEAKEIIDGEVDNKIEAQK